MFAVIVALGGVETALRLTWADPRACIAEAAEIAGSHGQPWRTEDGQRPINASSLVAR